MKWLCESYLSHLRLGIDQIDAAHHLAVFLTESTLEGDTLQHSQIFLCQVPFLAHQGTFRLKLQQADCWPRHHHLLHAGVLRGLNESPVVIAFGHIEAARVVVMPVHSMNVERVVVEADVVEALAYLPRLHQGNGVGAGHRAIAHYGVGTGKLLNASPVLLIFHFKQLADDAHIRPLPVVKAYDGSKGKDDNDK